MFTDEQIVAKYLQLRDRKTAMENKHKLELMPLNDAMKKIENIVGEMLAARGKDNMKTPVGTAYKKEIFSCTATDRVAFINFAIETDENMLNIQPSSTGVKDWIDKQIAMQAKLPSDKKQPVIIPGLKTDKIFQIIFRRV